MAQEQVKLAKASAKSASSQPKVTIPLLLQRQAANVTNTTVCNSKGASIPSGAFNPRLLFRVGDAEKYASVPGKEESISDEESS